ncbi:hypothetical protein ACIA8E_16945 [Streptomyces sp. NPDC051664]|uniref:hypothetical protein n=1 Tax=Streptomyces sp. NPDC051664 TaxID=3365668 RepID=UPI00378DB690
MIDYDGRHFSPVTEDRGESARVAVYRQSGDLLWGQFSGGDTRRGTLTGLCDADGSLRFAYSVVLGDGAVVSGRCRSVPTVLADGRVRLTETWERYGDHAAEGVSILEELAEVPDGAAAS